LSRRESAAAAAAADANATGCANDCISISKSVFLSTFTTPVQKGQSYGVGVPPGVDPFSLNYSFQQRAAANVGHMQQQQPSITSHAMNTFSVTNNNATRYQPMESDENRHYVPAHMPW
jgi:hypothetical protein